jgi:hypothetical protein
MCLTLCGCEAGSLRGGACERFVRNDDVEVRVRIAPREDGGRGVACRIRLTNVSGCTVVVFDDPSLPTIVHVPLLSPPEMGRADVFYGLSPAPAGVDFYGCEGFEWRALAPGQSHEWRVVVADPLVENAHYGNPEYDAPHSSFYRKRPTEMHWDTLDVRVACLLFRRNAEIEAIGGSDILDAETLIEIDGTEAPSLDHQRILGLRFGRSDLPHTPTPG